MEEFNNKKKTTYRYVKKIILQTLFSHRKTSVKTEVIFFQSNMNIFRILKIIEM